MDLEIGHSICLGVSRSGNILSSVLQKAYLYTYCGTNKLVVSYFTQLIPYQGY